MLKALRLMVALLASISAGATAASAQWPVLFGDQVRSYRNSNDEIHLFFDRDGYIYPPDAVRVTDFGVLRRAGSLRAYFRAERIAWARLAAHTGLNGRFTDGAWNQAQDKLITEASISIVRALGRGGSNGRTLIVLVHGFRVPDAEDSFQYAEQAIRRRYAALRPLFVHVHWDGQYVPLYAVPGLPVTWQLANRNAPLVGLGVRQLLARIPDGVPVRVISHSLGGAVVASALWNWPRGIRLNSGRQSQQARLRQEGQRYPLPTTADIRVGMIVPAIPGEVFSEVPRSLRAGGNYPLMVIGQNASDVVVSKMWIDARLMGSTALAVEPKEFCRHVMRIYGGDARAAARIVNFDRIGKVDFSHDLNVYFDREPIDEMLRLLLATPTQQLRDSAECQ